MSRKIDTLIAEHVTMLTSKYVSDFYENGGDTWWYTPEGKSLTRIPDYSTDISAAWEVIEKVKEFIRVGRNIKGRWWCEIERLSYQGEPDTWFVLEDTAPMAICIAALKAKGIKIGDSMEVGL